MIASEPRSGSSLLAEALRDTGLVGSPHEYFIFPELGRANRELHVPRPTPGQMWRIPVRRALGRPDWWALSDIRANDLPRFIDELIHRRTSANGVFSLKIHWRTYSIISERFGFDFDMLPQPIQWIRLERDDLVAQAVSFVKAQQTGSFGLRGPPAAAPADLVYDDDILVEAFLKVLRGRRAWRTFLADRNANPVEVRYEELRDDYAATVRRVVTSLGWELERVPDPELRRQADSLNDAWAQQFRQRHPRLVRGATND